ncbi:sideroflexin-4 [Hyperolius riggenbachi]|uniref:sideroflexin-4 n=1 Tax=Hyperolius riggenbachi TaxID=752182 RepID=UPI0035A3C70D
MASRGDNPFLNPMVSDWRKLAVCPHGPDSPTFIQRMKFWRSSLEPALLLASEAEIRKCSDDPEKGGKRRAVESDKISQPRMLVEVSVHPDTGKIIPLIFRTPGYLLSGAPLMVSALLPYKSPVTAFISQFFFQTYNVGFTATHRNRSLTDSSNPSQNPLYLSATSLLLAAAGASPIYMMKKLKVTTKTQSFVSRLVPPPLFALLGGMNVLLMRIAEREEGIQVVDAAGNIVGVSRKAGKKAVNETALSRSALFGVTALVPLLVRRSPIMLENPGVFVVMKSLIAALTYGIMIQASFGLFPQHGKIKRDDLEDDLKDKTTESDLFYHRGL